MLLRGCWISAETMPDMEVPYPAAFVLSCTTFSSYEDIILFLIRAYMAPFSSLQISK
jgi:hypothetical protein